jgi:hypothetical protein
MNDGHPILTARDLAAKLDEIVPVRARVLCFRQDLRPGWRHLGVVLARWKEEYVVWGFNIAPKCENVHAGGYFVSPTSAWKYFTERVDLTMPTSQTIAQSIGMDLDEMGEEPVPLRGAGSASEKAC